MTPEIIFAKESLASIPDLLALYRDGSVTPRQVVSYLLEQAKAGDPAIWIYLLSAEEVEPYLANLESSADPDALPLFGIPFAIKDNIDLAGIPTTAACAEYAYTPAESATVVEKLIAAGAIPLGKTNLDQFATGLVGVRSPYGVPKNPFHEAYVPGGSSSGSAVATALGQVTFALGTDTAGSGRVPAGLNNLIGCKPTRGLLSTRGVAPACRSLDCVSIFANTAPDAALVLRIAEGFDPVDAYSRPAPPDARSFLGQTFKFGVPKTDQLAFFGDSEAATLFAQAIAQVEAVGGERVEIDFQPFMDAARLLYEGPWVAERYAAIEAFIQEQPEAMHPVTRQIIEPASGLTAVSAFQSGYRLNELKRLADETWGQVDLLLTPTAGRSYRVEEVEAEPLKLNSNLGYYTNYMNLLDYCACAVPSGFHENGLPFGVTFVAPAFSDAMLLYLAERLHQEAGTGMGLLTKPPLPGYPASSALGPDTWISVAVCGAHMSGLPLNWQLTSRKGVFVKATRTQPVYRMYRLPPSFGLPERPGLIQQTLGNEGEAIDVEVWKLPPQSFGGFVAAIPPPLSIGKVLLEDGEMVSGFLCEPYATETATDITSLKSWRAYLDQPAS